METKWFITVYNYYVQGCIWCVSENKTKNEFLPPSSAMTAQNEISFGNNVSIFFQTPPIPFIFTAIIKLIISSKKKPLVCQNYTY